MYLNKQRENCPLSLKQIIGSEESKVQLLDWILVYYRDDPVNYFTRNLRYSTRQYHSPELDLFCDSSGPFITGTSIYFSKRFSFWFCYFNFLVCEM